jgi:type I restriction enzyme S subunit
MADYVSLTNQRRLKLFLPPIDEQKAIASILGSLDDKIDLNRRMNETLESMARALYKSWFVDFDPVVAKAAGKRPFGMDDATAALFPDRFVESELGPIPEGWEASTLGEHFRITMGQSPPGDTYNEEENGLPFYQGRRDFGDRYPSRRIYCSVPKRMAEPADTLVTVRAPVGDINMALEKCAIGRGVAAVRHTSDSRTFTFYTMQEMDREFEVYRGEGTLFGAINKGGFEELAFVAPPAGILSAYEEKASPMDDLIESNYSESQTLTHLRDLLLPKLLSGEIHIKDAEKVVQEVS